MTGSSITKGEIQLANWLWILYNQFYSSYQIFQNEMNKKITIIPVWDNLSYLYIIAEKQTYKSGGFC